MIADRTNAEALNLLARRDDPRDLIVVTILTKTDRYFFVFWARQAVEAIQRMARMTEGPAPLFDWDLFSSLAWSIEQRCPGSLEQFSRGYFSQFYQQPTNP